jgi:chitinase
VDLTDHLWNAYLGGSRAGVPRPFSDAVLDGFDFYVTAAAARDRRTLRQARQAPPRSQQRRCAYPDSDLAAALATGLFGHVHVLLYPATCGGRIDQLINSLTGQWMD